MAYKFGIRTEGTEEEFADIILDTANRFPEFTLVEVGFAGGATAKGIRSVLSENYKNPWKIISVDLPGAYQKEYATIYRNFNDKDLEVIFSPKDVLESPASKNSLYLKDSSAFLSQNLKDDSIHFCFIDACHCEDHVKSDFLAVVDKVVKGGVVAFHDVGVEEQGTDHQHDGKYIGVRKALYDLGLMDNDRYNWFFEKEIKGSRVLGGNGNSIGIFRKI